VVKVNLVALVAGNPRKGWRGGTPPDDVWEDQAHTFDTLDAAKTFVAGLHPEATTHVTIYSADADGEFLLWEQDRDADALDTLVDERPAPEPEPVGPPVPAEEATVPDGPPTMEAQK
jgi:hypothetical protein